MMPSPIIMIGEHHRVNAGYKQGPKPGMLLIKMK